MKAKERVLIVDDEIDWAKDLSVLLSEHFHCDVAPGPAEAMEAIREVSYALALVDIDLQVHETGIELLKRMRRDDPGLAVVMLTKSAELEDVVDSIKAGAFNYVVKGRKSLVPELIHVGKLAIDDARLRRAVTWWNEGNEDDGESALAAIVGSSRRMMEVKARIRELAPLRDTVLITGESGTGKELVARALHALSGRSRTGVFEQVNCAALTDNVAESKLYGHERGAFTGADRVHKGYFERADRGTLFLDEIGDMPLQAQGMVLHAVEYKTFKRLKGKDDIRSDVRILAATNRDLRKGIEQGTFRHDLYSRLVQQTIHLPPLRQRKEDIPELSDFFTKRLASNMVGRELGISQAAIDVLSTRDWDRGNVRDLENVIRGAIVRCDGHTIQPEHLRFDDEEIPEQFLPYKVAKTRDEMRFKRRYLSALLRHTKGNISHAARIAGVPRPSMSRMLKEVGIDAGDFRE